MKIFYSFFSMLTVFAMVVMPFAHISVYAEEVEFAVVDPEPEPEPTVTIQVCKILLDENGEVTTGAGLETEFSVDISGPNDFETTVSFSTELDPNTDLLTDLEGDDAYCQDVTLDDEGQYLYEEEVISGDGNWLEPLYHDYFTKTPTVLGDFGVLTIDGSDEDNDDTDGVMNLGENNKRKLVLVNQLEEVRGPKIIAHKIICEDEADLPNWATGQNDAPSVIDENTAKDFVEQHEGCYLARDWDFQWTYGNVANPSNPPSDPLYGEADDWTTFGSTDEYGMTMTTISDEYPDRISIREVLKEGYIPFTFGPNNKSNGDNVTAEFYCGNDIKNYDNLEWLQGVRAGDEIYCVAFNVPTEQDEPPLTCREGENLVKNGDFEKPKVTHNNGWDIFAEGEAGLEWLVSWIRTGGAEPSVASLELHRGVNGWLPYEGYQHAELDSDWQGPGGAIGEDASVAIYQDLNTKSGEEYDISFAFSPRPGEGGAQNILEVVWEGNVIATIGPEAGGSQTDWTVYEYTEVATTDGSRIEFRDAGDGNSKGTFIDNVLVCGVPYEKPEEPQEPELCTEKDSMWGYEIVSFNQGNQNGGGSVPVDRSDTSKALGPAENDNSDNFVSLGFGGEIVVKFDAPFPNEAGDDIQIFETSFGDPDYEGYPESATVYISQDGGDWKELGEVLTNGGSFDMDGVLDWAQYVKLVDTTQSSDHNDDADGFDLDGIKLFHCGTEGVENSKPEVDLKANGEDSLVIDEGTKVALSWTIEDGDGDITCSIDQGIGDVSEVNMETLGSVTETITYTITCIDEDGDETTDSVDITVEPDVVPNVVPTTQGGSVGGGTVAGANIGPGKVLGQSCGLYLNNFLHINSPNNNSQEVAKLQAFLIKYVDPNLRVTGVFDDPTFDAVWSFQLQYADGVIGPWANAGLLAPSEATGYVYKTTRRQINLMMCPALSIPVPDTSTPDSNVTDQV